MREMRKINYQLSRVYIGEVNKRKHFLYSIDGKRYMDIPERTSNVIIYDVRNPLDMVYEASEVNIICSLVELAKREEVETILMDVHHKYLQTIGRCMIEQVKRAIANKKKFETIFPRIQELSEFTASVVCDELGFNVAVHPITRIIDPIRVRNVAVPALKVEKFKKELTKYIYTYLLLGQQEIIFQDRKMRSSCISSCLEFSHITLTEELSKNEVYVQPELITGSVNVKKGVLKPEWVKATSEYQKVYVLARK